MLPDLIITNLNVYAFHIEALKLVRNYLPNKKKWLIVNSTAGLGLGLGYLFLLYLAFGSTQLDLFYFLKGLNIASYRDNTIIFTLHENKVSSVYKVLDTTSSLHFRQIINNFICAISTKSHLLLSCKEVTFSTKKFLH